MEKLCSDTNEDNCRLLHH